MRQRARAQQAAALLAVELLQHYHRLASLPSRRVKEVDWEAGMVYISTRSDFLNREREFEKEYLHDADK